jgi:hypothetical protein
MNDGIDDTKAKAQGSEQGVDHRIQRGKNFCVGGLQKRQNGVEQAGQQSA